MPPVPVWKIIMKTNIINMLGLAAVLITHLCFANTDNHGTHRADAHAPISIMGDHVHKASEWMVSYRYMSMSMSGNLLGANEIDNGTLVTTQANRFASMPMMPPTLRVVPQTMTSSMHMLGIMYAPTDNLTLVAMLSYLEKDMLLTTYQGMMGTNVLGNFSSDSSGMGDARVGALYRLFTSNTHHLHANLSLSLPTGSINETGQVLTPMNMQPLVRLPYAMQLGSGTYDLLPGLTYKGQSAPWSWGAQVIATFRTGDNKYNYRLGNQQKLNAWMQFAFAPSLSASLGFEYKKSQAIKGIDTEIMLPVQTADPANYGGTHQSIKAGLNWVGYGGHRLALEYLYPVKQKVNGVQMEMDAMWMLGYQKAF